MGARLDPEREIAYQELLDRAAGASRRMRLAGSVVFVFSAIATVVVAIAWITGAYSWELAVPILFGILTGGVLAGTASRGQGFGIDLGAARLELMLDAAARDARGDDRGGP